MIKVKMMTICGVEMLRPDLMESLDLMLECERAYWYSFPKPVSA